MKPPYVLIESVKRFFDKYPECLIRGKVTTEEEIGAIPKRLREKIPQWYIDILTTYPIADLEIWLPNDHGQEALKGKPYDSLPTMSMTFLNAQEFAFYSAEVFPMFKLIKNGYICIGEDRRTTSEGIYISIDNINPKVLMIYHDDGPEIKTMLSNAETLFLNFTDMIKYALPEKRDMD